ncbi:tumor necrosis factor receptor superfamily member 5-like isoform X3 [Heptranchias perlo]|uniref:tumor necrosis factor receptor superfamily member 5-like isoform X3 n=1 Tax=Heptranchias perlo TaxID=212740 RepID=UPI003559939C
MNLSNTSIKNPDLKARWHGSDSSSNSPITVCGQRIKYQEMVRVPFNAEKLNTVAVIVHVSLVTILIDISMDYIRGWCEERKLPFSGNIVYRHCTGDIGTTCKPCTSGEYVEHPNGFEKCLKCKACDRELGLEIEHECIYTRNTVCVPREGYYCAQREERGCQLGRKHSTCPPGKGVKGKATHFKDTVCVECPLGTYSSNDSSTEACKNWSKCEELNQNQVKPGSSFTDVECEKKTNLAAIIVPVLILILILAVILFALIWMKKYKKSRRHSDAERAQAEKQVPLIINQSKKEKTDQGGLSTPTPETQCHPSANSENTTNPNSTQITRIPQEHLRAGGRTDSGRGSQSSTEIHSAPGEDNPDTRTR